MLFAGNGSGSLTPSIPVVFPRNTQKKKPFQVSIRHQFKLCVWTLTPFVLKPFMSIGWRLQIRVVLGERLLSKVLQNHCSSSSPRDAVASVTWSPTVIINIFITRYSFTCVTTPALRALILCLSRTAMLLFPCVTLATYNPSPNRLVWNQSAYVSVIIKRVWRAEMQRTAIFLTLVTKWMEWSELLRCFNLCQETAEVWGGGGGHSCDFLT